MLLAVIVTFSASCQKGQILGADTLTPATFTGYGNNVLDPMKVTPGSYTQVIGYIFQSPVSISGSPAQRYEVTPHVAPPVRMTVIVYERNQLGVITPMSYSAEVLNSPGIGWYNHYILNPALLGLFRGNSFVYRQPMMVNLTFSWLGYPSTGYVKHFNVVGHM